MTAKEFLRWYVFTVSVVVISTAVVFWWAFVIVGGN